jgi:hypothetical protein
MTPRFLAFIRLLRAHGIRVSVAESLDALQSIDCMGLQDRELLRLGLRATLIKSQQDFMTFDALFERFFTIPRRRKRRRGQAPARQQPGMTRRPTLPTPGAALQPQQPTEPRLPQPDTQALELQPVAASMLQELANLEQAWQQQIAMHPIHRPAAESAPDRHLPHTRLDQEFPPDQLADMYRDVERLVLHLLTRRALRYRRARSGPFDLRRTVLRGLRNGREVPFPPAYRRRHVGKLRLMVLCDVSGSVWQVATFLLKLVHTLQAEFTSVRSLLFVNSLVEVTPLFQRLRFPDDLPALRQYPNLNLFGFSDFGRTFYQFYSDLLGEVSRDTVLLILGDARNNHFDPQAWTLGEIRQRCQRLLWLNPEARRLWDTGDSVLAAYAPYCDAVLECWTLEHLTEIGRCLLQKGTKTTGML